MPGANSPSAPASAKARPRASISLTIEASCCVAGFWKNRKDRCGIAERRPPMLRRAAARCGPLALRRKGQDDRRRGRQQQCHRPQADGPQVRGTFADVLRTGLDVPLAMRAACHKPRFAGANFRPKICDADTTALRKCAPAAWKSAPRQPPRARLQAARGCSSCRGPELVARDGPAPPRGPAPPSTRPTPPRRWRTPVRRG